MTTPQTQARLNYSASEGKRYLVISDREMDQAKDQAILKILEV